MVLVLNRLCMLTHENVPDLLNDLEARIVTLRDSL